MTLPQRLFLDLWPGNLWRDVEKKKHSSPMFSDMTSFSITFKRIIYTMRYLQHYDLYIIDLFNIYCILNWKNDLISRIEQLPHNIDDLRNETMFKTNVNDLGARIN